MATRFLLSVFAALAFVSCSSVRSDDPQVDAYRTQVGQLTTQVTELRTQLDVQKKATAEAQAAADVTDKTTRRAVGSAVGNLGIIGTDVGVKGLPDHAAGIDTESAKISTAMRLTSEETAPTLTAAEWADTKKALAKLKADNAAMQSAINTAEKAAKEADERAAAASAMVEAKNAEIAKQSERVKEAEATAFAWYKGVAWASLGTALVGILGALAAFGVPGTGPISALVGTFTKAFHKPTYAAAEQLPVARTVVQGADVAFTALKHLDAVLASKPDVRAVVATAMRGMTGDQCDTLECFVKTFAKANATDAGMSRAADQFLGQLRDSADTSGGAHSTFTTILSAFQKKADVLGNVSAMIRAVT